MVKKRARDFIHSKKLFLNEYITLTGTYLSLRQHNKSESHYAGVTCTANICHMSEDCYVFSSTLISVKMGGIIFTSTVKPAHVVTSIKGIFFGSLEAKYSANEPAFRGHLS